MDEKPSLDDAIKALGLAEDYESFAELSLHCYQAVHTREELEKADKAVNEMRQSLIEHSPEFATQLEEIRERARIESEREREKHKGEYDEIMRDIEMKARYAKIEAEKARFEILSSKDNTRFLPTNPPTEIKSNEPSEPLVCPICYDEDHGNVMDGTPICFKCMHKLVPQSELPKYNRKYRRDWKKMRKER